MVGFLFRVEDLQSRNPHRSPQKCARNKVESSTRLTAFGHARLDCPIASRRETLVAMKMDWDYFAPARFGRMHASEGIRVKLISPGIWNQPKSQLLQILHRVRIARSGK